MESMARLVALLALTAFAVGGCGGGDGDEGEGVLIVEERLASSGPFYVEGAISFFELRSGGVNRLEGRIEERVRRTVPEGRYELRAWQRPCGGNCELLDPPTDHCSGSIDVDGGATTVVVVTFRPTSPCTISVR